MANPIKPTVKTEFIPWLLMILLVAASVFFYENLPETIAIHWNFAGQPDGWGSGQAHSIYFPAVIIGMYLLFLLLPYFDPRKERYEQFAKTYHIFKTIIVAFMVIVYLVTSLSGLGYNLPVGVIIPGLVGLLFIILGNYLSKVKANWFVGIRTPWTMSSEEVWNKTHRFGGKMFIFAGLVMIAQIFLPPNWKLPVFAVSMTLVILGTIFYSYVLYLKEKKK